tara:strand:- start:33526 stop:34194 length:669 start_codon:yes stop_codon:yes gene_type:complete
VKTIFISKDASELSELAPFFKNKSITMVCRSLIKFEPVNFEGPKGFDVIFFSSIRCAQFLETSECIDLHSYSLCCAGPQTASRLKRMGYEPAFVGKNASMPDVVSKDFTKWLGKRRVFIPCSNRSLKSIEAHIPENQVHSIVVYKTLLAPKKINSGDIMVFSSPSNVHSYFSENKLQESSVLISWGSSTSFALKEYGVVPNFILKKGSVIELKELLDNHFSI